MDHAVASLVLFWVSNLADLIKYGFKIIFSGKKLLNVFENLPQPQHCTLKGRNCPFNSNHRCVYDGFPKILFTKVSFKLHSQVPNVDIGSVFLLIKLSRESLFLVSILGSTKGLSNAGDI